MTTRATMVYKFLKFIIKHFQLLMKIGWGLQWVFILVFVESLWFGWYWIGFSSSLLSFGMHVLTVVYKGFILDYLQGLVDPFKHLDRNTRRKLKRKIKKDGVS